MPKINVSFKNTTKDMRLYTAAAATEEKSEFMKNALEFYLKYRDLEHKIIELLKREEEKR